MVYSIVLQIIDSCESEILKRRIQTTELEGIAIVEAFSELVDCLYSVREQNHLAAIRMWWSMAEGVLHRLSCQDFWGGQFEISVLSRVAHRPEELPVFEAMYLMRLLYEQNLEHAVIEYYLEGEDTDFDLIHSQFKKYLENKTPTFLDNLLKCYADNE